MSNRILLQPGPEIGAIATCQIDGRETTGKVIAIDEDGNLTIQATIMDMNEHTMRLYFGDKYRP